MSHSVQAVINTALLDVRLHSAASTGTQWSEAFWVDSPRLVIPQRGNLRFAQAKQQFVCTPLNVLAVDATAPYRMRRFGHAHVTSLVIVPKTMSVTTGTHLLSMQQLLSLRGLQAKLHAGNLSAAGQACANLASTNQHLLALEELCAQLLGLSEPQQSNVLPTQQSRRAVITAYEYLAEHATRNLSLSEIARASAASPFHLAREFKRSVGATLHQTQLRLRIAAALLRIDGGASDFSALALDLGFSSHAHFSRVFKASVGVPPSVYRRGSSG